MGTIRTNGGSRSTRNADEPLFPCITAPCDARCCDAAEVPLLDSDILRLEAATGRPAEDFVDADDGWRVLKGTGTEGGCVFLGTIHMGTKSARGCTVHDERPEACRYYPFILRGEADPQVGRDTLCPFRSDFTPPPDVRERLLSLERQLDEERHQRG